MFLFIYGANEQSAVSQDTNSLGLYTDKIRNLPEEKFGFVIVKFILKFLVVINIPLVFL